MGLFARLRSSGDSNDANARSGKFWDGFGSALLDRGLPKIREWVRSRFGDAASIASLRVDGGALILEGGIVPLGERVRLLVDRASVETLSVMPLRVRLVAMEGRLCAIDPAQDNLVRFEAPVRFQADDIASTDEVWVHGTLRCDNARWLQVHGAGETSSLSGEVTLVVGPNGWQMRDGAFEAGEAHVRLDASGALSGEALENASLHVYKARANHLLDALVALSGKSMPGNLAPLKDLKLNGKLAYDGAATVDATLEAAKTRVHAKARISAAGAIEGALVEGNVGVSDVLSAELPKAAAWVRDIVAKLSLRATGTLDAPLVTGTAAVDEASVRIDEKRFMAAPRLMNVAVDARLDERRLRFDGRGRMEGGGDLSFFYDQARFGDAADRRATCELTARGASALWMALVARASDLSFAVEGAGPADWYVPRGAKLDLHARPTLDRMHVLARVSSPVSDLTLQGAVTRNGEASIDATLMGHLGFADALVVGLFPSDVRPLARGAVHAVEKMRLTGPLTRLLLEGDVRAPRLEVGIASRPAVPAFVFDGLTAHLGVGTRELAYRDLRASGYGGRFVVDGAIPFTSPTTAPASTTRAPLAKLALRDASSAFIEALAALSTASTRVTVEREGQKKQADEFWVPRSASLSGELVWAHDGALSSDVALTTSADTALIAKIVLSPEMALDGSTLRGRVAVADALTAGMFDTAIRPFPRHSAELELTLKGPLESAVLFGRVRAPLLLLGMPDDPRMPPLACKDGACDVRIDVERVVWHRAEARVLGGTIGSSGMVGYAPKFTGLQATLTWRDVQVGDAPLDLRGRKLAELVRGRATGQLRFTRVGPSTQPFTARGALELEDAAYPALAQAGPQLRSFGLSTPAVQGRNPLQCQLEATPQGWHVRDLAADVAGIAVHASCTIGFDNSLQGAGHVDVEESFLSTSPLLLVPASLAGNLRVPIRLHGTLAAPRFEADTMTTLSTMFIDNRITGAAADVLEAVFGTSLRATKKEEEPFRDVAAKHAALDQLLDGDPETEAYFAELVNGGMEPDDALRHMANKPRAQSGVRVR